jgi:hypothetical protein
MTASDCTEIQEIDDFGGALGGTRTPTILLTATSRQRVYQFRHERLSDRHETVPDRIEIRSTAPM